MRGCFIAIPTYWTYPGGEGPEEIVFDHPTPLDTPGTLRRTLESLTPLAAGVEVEVSVVAAATAPALEAAVEDRVREVIESPPLPYPVRLFAASHLSILQDFCRTQGRPEWLPLLSLAGYAQIRNLTLILANICGARVLLSLDDDEVIGDPDFLVKVEEDLEVLEREHPVFGLAGIYRNQDGGVLLPEPAAPWAGYWPKMRWLNAALQELALAGPRLKPTYLGFGGNLALPAALGRMLPFDPAITRGEDTDYLLNARMFGVPFFLDNTLSIIHLPPDKPNPTWLRLRQDLVRFCYTRLKLRQQEPGPGRETTSFWLQTSTDKFYPDFVCLLADGRILVVEYKNATDWSNDDSKEKRALGELWAERSGGTCVFYMPKGSKDVVTITSKI